ncbi:MAG: SAVED domain-containing protein [Qipengyuania sp.]|nr:SAVED domain-containing protein [Qipengyuania sp.]
MNDDADTRSRIALGGLGSLLAAAGVGILSPGFKDAVLAGLNRWLDLGLYLEAPPWVGALMVLFGGVLLLLAFTGQGRLERAMIRLFDGRGSTIGTFLAVKHVGFAPVVRDIRREELPPDIARRDLRHLQVDLSLELQATPPGLEAALSKQLRMPDQITAILGVNPDADLGYCGVIHAPFQLLAGYQLASWMRLRSFEWHRHDHRWTALTAGPGPDLGVTTQSEPIGFGPEVAISVEVSYAIAAAEIAASVPAAGQLIRVTVAAPALDCITHEGQVAELARQFRDALDAVRGLPAGARVHVFCSAPMSVGFALGRIVSRTLHPPVRVYAYDRNAPKPYPWGIEVNGAPGAGQVVRN